MSDTTPKPDTKAAPQNGADQAPSPVLRLASHYVKDLSFENPNAPLSIQNVAKPDIQIEVNLGARGMGPDYPLGRDLFEVELSISARATVGEKKQVLYVVESNFAGMFLIQNVTENQMGAALLVEAPKLLFPYARMIIAEAVRAGGFTPLVLEPLDFQALYEQQVRQAQELQAAAAAPSDGSEPPAGTA
jgi:preprotein translocase subunit SecB